MLLSPRGAERVASLCESFPQAPLAVAKSNQEVLERSDLVILSVLPAQVQEVLSSLEVPEDMLLVSLIAGVSRETLAALSGLPLEQVREI